MGDWKAALDRSAYWLSEHDRLDGDYEGKWWHYKPEPQYRVPVMAPYPWEAKDASDDTEGEEE